MHTIMVCVRKHERSADHTWMGLHDCIVNLIIETEPKYGARKKKLCPISSHPPINQSVMQANGMKTVGRRSLTVPRTKSVKSFDILQPHPRVAIHVGLHQKAKLFLIGKIAHMIRVSGG
uniref:Uncharacterized protein n=1 Tax=Anopheles culicifacies TaxID=139723 RepID=A0A182MTS2_9DIPT